VQTKKGAREDRPVETPEPCGIRRLCADGTHRRHRRPLYGPVFGAVLRIYLKNSLSGITQQWNPITGILFVVSVLAFRRGVLRELKEKIVPVRPDGPRPDRS